MSIVVQVDYAELLKRIEGILCPECREKFKAIDVPLVQAMKLEDLVKRVRPPA